MGEPLTRRQFMTAAAAVAATGPFVREAQSDGASEKPVRVGFVGLGGRGPGMLRHSLGITGGKWETAGPKFAVDGTVTA